MSKEQASALAGAPVPEHPGTFYMSPHVWGVSLQQPYIVLAREMWSFEVADTIIAALTTRLGPDLVSTLIALAPALLGKGRVEPAAILLERADSLRTAVEATLRAPGLRTACLHGLSAAQVSNAGALLVPVLGPGNVITPGIFRDPLSVYACALGGLVENLAPLDHGQQQRRAQSTDTSAAAGLKAQAQAASGPALSHLRIWWETRGA